MNSTAASLVAPDLFVQYRLRDTVYREDKSSSSAENCALRLLSYPLPGKEHDYGLSGTTLGQEWGFVFRSKIKELAVPILVAEVDRSPLITPLFSSKNSSEIAALISEYAGSLFPLVSTSLFPQAFQAMQVHRPHCPAFRPDDKSVPPFIPSIAIRALAKSEKERGIVLLMDDNPYIEQGSTYKAPVQYHWFRTSKLSPPTHIPIPSDKELLPAPGFQFENPKLPHSPDLHFDMLVVPGDREKKERAMLSRMFHLNVSLDLIDVQKNESLMDAAQREYTKKSDAMRESWRKIANQISARAKAFLSSARSSSSSSSSSSGAIPLSSSSSSSSAADSNKRKRDDATDTAAPSPPKVARTAPAPSSAAIPPPSSSSSSSSSSATPTNFSAALSRDNPFTTDRPFSMFSEYRGMTRAGIKSGTLLQIDPTRLPISGDIVLVKIDRDILCRRFVSDASGARFVATDSGFPILSLGAGITVEIIGVVTGIKS